MNAKQEKFCELYAVCGNAVKSYMEAYGCSYESACSNAYRLMEKEGIQQRIDEFQEVNKGDTILLTYKVKKRLEKLLMESIGDIDIALSIYRQKLGEADQLNPTQLLNLARFHSLQIDDCLKLTQAIASIEQLNKTIKNETIRGDEDRDFDLMSKFF